MPKFCMECGYSINDPNAKFCPKCGSKLPIISSNERDFNLSPNKKPLIQPPNQKDNFLTKFTKLGVDLGNFFESYGTKNNEKYDDTSMTPNTSTDKDKQILARVVFGLFIAGGCVFIWWYIHSVLGMNLLQFIFHVLTMN